ncbi:hypothetical protein [Intestinibacter sp.]|uniref:hypothetical protein n=1 Tax=Intestinibacter sp. TaxID=1965304 RepID=UPI002A7492D5|nr:hypothetical protein [Intestinibacter sp.]MDY2737987.1 hypothetical protein [Intestinibacter sp.]
MEGISILLSTFSYLVTYMKIKENGKTIYIYEKLKYIPINFENITFVRIQYLLKHTCEVLVIYIVSNFIGGIFIQEIDINVNLIIWLIVYSSLFVLIFGLLPDYLKIIPLNRKKVKILYKNDINKNVVFVFNILKWIIRIINDDE